MRTANLKCRQPQKNEGFDGYFLVFQNFLAQIFIKQEPG